MLLKDGGKSGKDDCLFQISRRLFKGGNDEVWEGN